MVGANTAYQLPSPSNSTIDAATGVLFIEKTIIARAVPHDKETGQFLRLFIDAQGGLVYSI